MIGPKPLDLTPVSYEEMDATGAVVGRGTTARVVYERMLMSGVIVREISASDVNDVGLKQVTTEGNDE